MQDGNMRDEGVLRTTVRCHSETSSRNDRIVYFSIVERHFIQGRLRGEKGCSMSLESGRTSSRHEESGAGRLTSGCVAEAT